eukprot:2397543-Alexandrium_andersonii.AAC.1
MRASAPLRRALRAGRCSLRPLQTVLKGVIHPLSRNCVAPTPAKGSEDVTAASGRRGRARRPNSPPQPGAHGGLRAPATHIARRSVSEQPHSHSVAAPQIDAVRRRS